MAQNTLQVNNIILNLDSGELSGPQGQCRLTPMEFKLLNVLMRHPGEVLSRAFLMKMVWETDYLGDTRTLDVHISWLRKKLDECVDQAEYLKTVRGVGYFFGNFIP